MEIVLRSRNTSAHIRVPSTGVVAPQIAADFETVAEALANPLELPPLGNCVVAGDRVTIAADPATPELSRVLGEVSRQLIDAASELDLTILLPAEIHRGSQEELLNSIRENVDQSIHIHVHDPSVEQQRRYLASSSGGERIYLSQHLIDSDLNVTVGPIGFDPLLKFSGTSSLFYPALSDADAIRRRQETVCSGETAAPKHFSRETVDEIGWLLGSQFAVQVLPASEGAIAHAICGTADQVMARGIEWLCDHWRVEIPAIADLVVISVSPLAGFEWRQLGRALAASLPIVEEGGRIAVVADLPGQAGPALDMLRRCSDPEDLRNPLRLEPLADAEETLHLIAALQKADVYLLSPLSDEEIEELGMIPLTSESELQRLIERSANPCVIQGANFAQAHLKAAARATNEF